MILSAIKQMEQYARENPSVISLSQGIPSVPTDDLIKKDVVRALTEGDTDRYSEPAGLLTLRRLIAQELQKHVMEYDTSEIIVTAGAIEALGAIFLALLTPGDEVIIPTPSYAAYSRVSSLAQVTVKNIVLEENTGWRLPVRELEKAITAKTKAILLCNPNNPTGSCYSEEEMKAICALARKHNFYVIVDDVYQHIYFSDFKRFNPAEDKELKNLVIRVVSLSKDFAMSGWRIGFLHTDRSLIEKILPVHDSLINCAPVVSQYAALSALTHTDEIVPVVVDFYKKQRELMRSYLKELDEYLSFSEPQGTYFFFPKISGITDATAFCLNLVRQAQVAVVPGDDFGPGGEGHVRLCFGRSEDAIMEGMERFSSFVKGL